MTTIGDGSSEQRVYSAPEIDACLRFVKLNSAEVQWWPCLVFSNMVELQQITEQLKLWTTLSQRRELTMMYMQHLPGSATCRVALLMGQPPAPNTILKFDVNQSNDEDAFILEPFYDNVLQFGMIYSQNEQYLHAVQQTLPLLQEVTDSLRRNKEQRDSTVVPMNSSTKPKASSTTTLKRNVQISEISVEGRENSLPLANAKKVAPKISDHKTDIPKIAASPCSARRNSPRQLPAVNASTTSAIKKSSLTIPSIPLPTTTETKLTEGARSSSNKLMSSVSSKQYESVEIPTFQEVKQSLVKGGYKFTAKSYCRPAMVIPGMDFIAPQSFVSVAAFRHDLCVYGVNCRCGQMAMDEDTACACWTADEKWYIKLWVRYDVIRSVPQKPSIGQVPIISSYVAQQYLIRLGYYSRQLASPLLTTDQVHDLFRFLSRHGLPLNDNGNEDASCDYTQLTPQELLSLEYFISSSHYCVNTL